ncbi:MAG: hypothetical protein ACI30S_03275 [Muribaculaceae bacterium]
MGQKVSKQGILKVRNVYAFRACSWQNFNICAVKKGKNFNICAVDRGKNFNICAVNDGEMLDIQKIKYYLCRNLKNEGNGLE